MADAIEQSHPQPLVKFGQRLLWMTILGRRINMRNSKIGLWLGHAICVDPNGAPRREIANFPIGCERLRNTAEDEKTHRTCRVWISRNSPPRNERLYLRGKPQRVTVVGVIKRLDAVMI